MAAVYGKLELFDSRNESWSQYSERLEAYFTVNDIDDEVKKRAILQTVLESTTYALLRNLVRPNTIPDKTFAELKAVLDLHFNPRPSKIVERLHFNNRSRKHGESIAVYISELRKLSEHCCFGANIDEMIRDRLVCGINDETMQRRLLAEEDTLTLQEATRIVQAMETATKNTHQIKNGDSNASSANQSANHVSSHNRRSDHRAKGKFLKKHNSSNPNNSQNIATPQRQKFTPGSNQCNRCTSTAHKSHECPFLKEKCFNCEKTGHIAKACQSAVTEKVKKGEQRKSNNSNRANHIDQAQTSSREYDFPVCAIISKMEETNTQTPPPDIVTCQVNGIDIKFEVDNGSGHSMMCVEDAHKIPRINKIKRFSRTLRSYTGNPVKILGSTTVTVSYKSREADLPVLLVEGRRPNLCGRKWLFSKLNMLPSINENQVNHMKQSNVQLEEILQKHEEVFKPGLGKLRNIQVKLHIKPDAVPKYLKARTVPYQMTEKVEAELQRMENEGIIERVPFSRFASPIVPAVKPNGNIRICGDFKSTTNPAINTEIYPIPRAQDIFSRLAGCKHFTKIDLREAYNQLELDPESREYTVINTSKGLFQHNRLPYGICSSSAIFQRHMEMVLQEMKQVMPFQDDVLIGSKTEEDHLQQIDQFLSIIQRNGLRIRKEKCHFFVSEIEFLGHRLDADGLHPLNSKMEEIMNAPEPENIETLRSFLGMINYYGRFLPNHSSNLAPLHQLLHKDIPWTWGHEQKTAFQKAKTSLQTSKMLTHFDIDKEVILSCDASPYGLGGVISHMVEESNGQLTERPIAFASRSLTAAEKNYSQLEREALAIVFSVTKFRDYIYGKKFTLLTDHQPLVSLLSADKPVPPMAAARIQRWALLLAAFQYEIKFRKGSSNQNADALSRLPLPNTQTKTPVPTEYVLLMKDIDESPVTSVELERITATDITLTKVAEYMRHGFPKKKLEGEMEIYRRRQSELSNFEKILFMGNRLVIPHACREKFLKELHNTHQGIVQMKSLARSRIWWPQINQDIEELIKQCHVCQEHSSLPPSKFQPWPQVTQPWQRVHTDFAGPIEGKYILITVDAYSKWIEADITRSTSTDAVISCMRNHIARYGIMLNLITDNGTCFTSQEFKNFITANGIKHMTTAPYHPQSNGQAERSVRTIKTRLKKLSGGTTEEIEIVNSGLDQFQSGSLEARISRILMNHRRTSSKTGKTPAELMLGRNIITRLDLCHPDLRTTTEKSPEMRKTMNPALEKTEPKTKFSISQLVYVKNFGRGSNWRKGKIISHLGRMMYEVETACGTAKRHQNQLRPRLLKTSTDVPGATSTNVHETTTTDVSADVFTWMPNDNRTTNPANQNPVRIPQANIRTTNPATQSRRLVTIPDQQRKSPEPKTSNLQPRSVSRPSRTIQKPARYCT